MNVAAYTQLHRTAVDGTGISRHAVNMIRGLAASPDMRVRVAASRRDLFGGTRIGADSGLAGMPVVPLPLSFQSLERLWWVAGWPPIESWTGPIDWVYCPADAYVPTRKARLAITIHDVAWLEPSLPWSHTPEHQRFARRLRLKMRPILTHANLFLTVSEFTKSRMTDLMGIPASNIVNVGNAAEASFFIDPAVPPPRPAEAPSGPYLLTVGGLSDRKGAPQIIGLARALQERCPEIRIAVAGTSDREWRTKTNDLPNLEHLGYVNPATLPALMHHALALYFPSRYEGFGIPIVEAMAAGTPTIISPHSSLPEVAGDAAIVARDDTPEKTASMIIDLLRDDSLRLGMIETGRARASRFTWQRCVARLRQTLLEA